MSSSSSGGGFFSLRRSSAMSAMVRRAQRKTAMALRSEGGGIGLGLRAHQNRAVLCSVHWKLCECFFRKSEGDEDEDDGRRTKATRNGRRRRETDEGDEKRTKETRDGRR